MLFHRFHSQEERRNQGGSCFIELSYVRPESGAPAEAFLSRQTFPMWQPDSLYVHGDDDHAFFSAYSRIFTGGLYPSGETGVMDLCGVTCYSPRETARILTALQTEHLPDQDALVRWLEKAPAGFMIFGL